MALSSIDFSDNPIVTVDFTRPKTARSKQKPDHNRIMTEIFNLYIGELKAYAMAMCRNPDLANDIVQQTCMKAWQARNSYEAGRPAKPWLFRIMRNEYLQFIRKKSYVTNIEDDALEPEPDCTDTAHRQLDIISLYDKLIQLPEDQRSAITLVIAMGLTYDEAGAISDCPAGTVKSRVNRAKLKLREAMKLSVSQPFPKTGLNSYP